jgi:para-nitrobenzyl esterase
MAATFIARATVAALCGSVAGLAAMGSARAAATEPLPPSPEIVQTRTGPVQAVSGTAMQSFFAIPFAAPPTGDLRWRAPQPAAHWTVPLHNMTSGAACVQTASPLSRPTSESEDCLTLDIHRPSGTAGSNGKGPLPVMVWIHGGAFATGGARIYSDPSALVSKGVIVVAIQYRLGAMGFLAHPALRDADGASGNYGIMDQQAALRWVRDNIAGFGGDPGNVTIFGESAGGFSVLTHLASPGSKGLFHKAIIESGAYGLSGQPTQATQETHGTEAVAAVLAEAGADLPPACAAGAQTAACLRALPASMIQPKLMKAFAKVVPNIVPSIDGKVLPRSVKAVFAAGDNARVPVINGANEHENLLFLAMAEMGRRLQARPPVLDPTDKSMVMTADDYAKEAKTLSAQTGVPLAVLTERGYPLTAYGQDPALQPTLAGAAAGTDTTFSCTGVAVSDKLAAEGTQSWMYEFRDEGSPPLIGTFGGKYVLATPQGAEHAGELPYIFNMTALNGPERVALKQTMAGYWTNFAKTGNPNGSGLPAWPAFGSGRVQALDVPARGGVVPMPVASFRTEHKCDTVWTQHRL